VECIFTDYTNVPNDWGYITGWWYTYPSEKYEFVSWDYHSQLNGKIIQMFQTTNQNISFYKQGRGLHKIPIK